MSEFVNVVPFIRRLWGRFDMFCGNPRITIPPEIIVYLKWRVGQVVGINIENDYFVICNNINGCDEQVQLHRYGNSLVLNIPTLVKNYFCLEENDSVALFVNNDKVIVKRVDNSNYERLMNFYNKWIVSWQDFYEEILHGKYNDIYKPLDMDRLSAMYASRKRLSKLREVHGDKFGTSG